MSCSIKDVIFSCLLLHKTSRDHHLKIPSQECLLWSCSHLPFPYCSPHRSPSSQGSDPQGLTPTLGHSPGGNDSPSRCVLFGVKQLQHDCNPTLLYRLLDPTVPEILGLQTLLVSDAYFLPYVYIKEMWSIFCLLIVQWA